ncbi:Fc.00g094160.m01.CDS01 [Cosmosporella sp. VM-42]
MEAVSSVGVRDQIAHPEIDASEPSRKGTGLSDMRDSDHQDQHDSVGRKHNSQLRSLKKSHSDLAPRIGDRTRTEIDDEMRKPSASREVDQDRTHQKTQTKYRNSRHDSLIDMGDGKRNSPGVVQRALIWLTTGEDAPSSQGEQTELKKQLQETLRKLEKQSDKYQELSGKCDEQRRVLAGQKREIRECRSENARLKKDVISLQGQLKQAKQTILANESVVTKAHATIVSVLASDVSMDFPDDMVKTQLQRFFQGDFLSWCADMSIREISDPSKVEDHMRHIGLINSSQSYSEAAPYLKLDLHSPDGSASFLLLQAALSNTLCRLFLTDPYFLIQGSSRHSSLVEFEEVFSAAQRDDAIGWRVKTVELLQQSIHLREDGFIDSARDFAQEFSFLLQKLDKEAEEDLMHLFSDFAGLALRLWKKNTTIHVPPMSHFAQDGFQLKPDIMEADGAAVSVLGGRLSGRPIGVMTRPLIVSEPVVRQGQPKEEVIWSKAGVWVSGLEEEGEELVDRPMSNA